jgi:hypothetical protein
MLCSSFANPFANSRHSHVHFPCHSELSRGPVTRPLLTQSGRERKSIVDDGFNVLRAAIIFERAADRRRHTNG